MAGAMVYSVQARIVQARIVAGTRCAKGKKGSIAYMKKDTPRSQDTGACPVKKTSIGGQALMEGIMMRGPQKTALAVRNPQGEMVIETFPVGAAKKSVVRKIPVVRGIFNFVDSMIFGYKCLMRSAEIAGLEEAEEELAKEKAAKKVAKQAAKVAGGAKTVAESVEKDAPAGGPDTDTAGADGGCAVGAVTSDASADPPTDVSVDTSAAKDVKDAKDTRDAKEKKGTSPLMVVIMVVSVLFAMAIAVGLFVFLPTWLYDTAATRVDWMQDNRYVKSIFTGVLKILLLVGYMAAVSLMKDIRRTFRYHGAEHKTIFCYEKGLPLTVENVRMQRRFHPRCGTSFLILMLLVSILIGFFIPPSLPPLLYSGIRILLIPIIMGVGYELIKFCGRHDNWLTHIISAPGVALQHITVFEPDDSMIECAIAAVKEVIPEDDSDRW